MNQLQTFGELAQRCKDLRNCLKKLIFLFKFCFSACWDLSKLFMTKKVGDDDYAQIAHGGFLQKP